MNKNLFGLAVLTGMIAFSCTQKKAEQPLASAGDSIDRTMLPIKEPSRPCIKSLMRVMSPRHPGLKLKLQKGLQMLL